jgi:hypothetical protein
MLGAEIPDGLLYGVIPVLATFWLGFLGWLVILLWRITIRLENHEGRLETLEEGHGTRIRRTTTEIA